MSRARFRPKWLQRLRARRCVGGTWDEIDAIDRMFADTTNLARVLRKARQ